MNTAKRIIAESQEALSKVGVPEVHAYYLSGRLSAALEVAEGAQSLLSLLADLTDADPCRFDHHGYCQAHSWMSAQPSCPHGRAKAILDAEKEA